MIAHYEKRAFDVAFGKDDSTALKKVVGSLNRSYRNVFTAILQATVGAKTHDRARLDDISPWLEGPKNQPHVMGMYTLRTANEPIIIVQMLRMEMLTTDFAKKHHGKGLAYLLTYSFCADHDGASAIDKFHIVLRKALAVALKRKDVPNDFPIYQLNGRVQELETKPNATPPIPADIVPVLNLLEDRGFRTTIIRTRQAKDPTFVNIVKSTGFDEAKVRRHVDTALAQSVLARQYNAVCKSCGNALARVPSLEKIAHLAAESVACAKCKTPLTEQSYEECFVVNDKIGRLIDGSKWMCMYVRHHLAPFVATGKILTEVVDGPNELDLVANIDGSLLLAELKDAKFSIGHAYSFVGKCSQYRPEIAIICSTEPVEKEVKEYIANTGIPAYYIEGLAGIKNTLGSVFSQVNAQALTRLLSEIPWVGMLTRAALNNFGEKLPIVDESYAYHMPAAFRRRMGPWRM